MSDERIGESQHELSNDSRWDMSEVAPFRHEDDSGIDKTENAERDPSLVRQEKEEEINDACKKVEEVFEKMSKSEVVSAEQPVIHEAQRNGVQKKTVGEIIRRTAVVTSNTAIVLSVITAAFAFFFFGSVFLGSCIVGFWF